MAKYLDSILLAARPRGKNSVVAIIQTPGGIRTRRKFTRENFERTYSTTAEKVSYPSVTRRTLFRHVCGVSDARRTRSRRQARELKEERIFA
jgi:hypothetical protein